MKRVIKAGSICGIIACLIMLTGWVSVNLLSSWAVAVVVLHIFLLAYDSALWFVIREKPEPHHKVMAEKLSKDVDFTDKRDNWKLSLAGLILTLLFLDNAYTTELFLVLLTMYTWLVYRVHLHKNYDSDFGEPESPDNNNKS